MIQILTENGYRPIHDERTKRLPPTTIKPAPIRKDTPEHPLRIHSDYCVAHCANPARIEKIKAIADNYFQ